MSSSSSSSNTSPNVVGKPRLLTFLRNLLEDVNQRDVIQWIDKQHGEFQLRQPHTVARMWGEATGNSEMTYDKMSRGLRYFYTKKNGGLKKMSGKDARYRFVEEPPFNVSSLLGAPSVSPPTSTSSPTSSVSSSTSSTSLEESIQQFAELEREFQDVLQKSTVLRLFPYHTVFMAFIYIKFTKPELFPGLP